MSARILVVEDDAILREMYTLKLGMEGYAVSAAADGAEGLALATSRDFDVILLDILMPRLTGIQFLQAYLPHPRKAIVIVISNKSSPDEIISVKRMGAADYLIKSQYTPDEVVAKMEEHLEGATQKSREQHSL